MADIQELKNTCVYIVDTIGLNMPPVEDGRFVYEKSTGLLKTYDSTGSQWKTVNEKAVVFAETTTALDDITGTNGQLAVVKEGPELYAWIDSSWQLAGGKEELYSNSTPMPQALGGFAKDTTFENKTMKEMWDGLLYPTLNPSLTNPSSSLTSSTGKSSLKEVGETIQITLTTNFNRGKINPAYGTSGFRSGLPNTYNYTGDSVTSSVSSTSLTDTQTIADYEVTQGAHTWSSSVSYDAGEQPKNNKGGNYSTPLPAGTTSASSITVTGVYPWFATSSVITGVTKQPLSLMNAAYVQVTMVGEPEDGSAKQVAEFPEAWSEIKGISFYNTVSSKWEWLTGTAAGSLGTFTKTTKQETVQGELVNYNVYTHNGSMIGSRQLRFHTNTTLAQ